MNTRGSARAVEARRQALIEEAKYLAAVRHANIVESFGLCYNMPGGGMGMVIELADSDLSKLIHAFRDNRVRDVRELVPYAAHIGEGVAKALAYLHETAFSLTGHALVHRDLKPQNVLLRFTGESSLEVRWV